MSTENNALNQRSLAFQVGSSTTTNNLDIQRSASGLFIDMNDQTDNFGYYNNAGNPEGVVAANIGSICANTSGGEVYVKTTDTVNTGWTLLGAATAGVSLSPFIVGPTNSDFSTIQAAINQAVTDGASPTNQFNIYIKPQSGGYTENLTLPTGVNLMGMDENYNLSQPGIFFGSNGRPATNLIGTITHTSGDSKVSNLYISPASDSTVFSMDAVGGLIIIKNCYIIAPGASAILMDFGNSDSFVISECLVNCSGKLFETSAVATFTGTITSSHIITAVESTFTGGGALLNLTVGTSRLTMGLTGVAGNNSMTVNVVNSLWGGIAGSPLLSYGATSTGNVTARNSQISTGAASYFILNNASTTVRLKHCSLLTAAAVSTGPASPTQAFMDNIDNSGVLLKALSTGFNGSECFIDQAGVETLDATVTTLASVVVNTTESIVLRAKVIGAQIGHTNAVGGDLMIVARRDAGNITIVGVVDTSVKSSSTATFTADVDIGTQSVRIRVTGVIATTYNWVCTFEYQKVLTNA